MGTKNFRIIISGGSIAGLSLALMLEKNGIDFLVLEAYPEIAPQVGASIGMLPNGLRILDQLGCYEDVWKCAKSAIDQVCFRGPDGREFYTFNDVQGHSIQRHGYPIFFLDRQMVIQILYNHIQDKSKILTKKRVIGLRQSDSGVQVTTKDGSNYTGDIIVGGDGIHSTVRQEMWRCANESQPGYIASCEESALPATYACIFGISVGVPEIASGVLHSVLNEHYSFLVSGGPDDRVYWFLVRNLGKTVYGTDIPRFTKDDEEELAEKHWNDPITPNIKFSDIYTHKISSVYTSLPEYVYQKWHFGRMMTMGDASHKFEPISGQGGNTAIETAAALTNRLVKALKSSSSGSGHLSDSEIFSVFEDVQNLRSPRAWQLVRASHQQQRFEAMETPLLKFIAQNLVPVFGQDKMFRKWVDAYLSAIKLDMLEVPDRPREIPYDDELLRKPRGRGLLALPILVVFIFFAWLGLRLLFGAGTRNGTWSLVAEILNSGTFADFDIPLKGAFIGYPAVDRKLRTMVVIFFPAITGLWSTAQRLQSIYFLASFLPLIAIFTIEGYRKRNSWSLLQSPTLWACLYQLFGVAVIAPLYYLASVFTSRNPTYYIPTTRAVPITVGKALLPALLLGYAVPTILMFLPYGDTATTQSMIAFWQPAPIYVVILIESLSRLIGLGERKKTQSPLDSYKNYDMPLLNNIYRVTFAISACAHIATIIICMKSTQVSLTSVLIPQKIFTPVGTMAEGVFIFLQNDFLSCFLATFVWGIISSWDLYRVGMSNVSLLKSFGMMMAGLFLVGPGAAMAATWYWREQIMSRTRFGKQKHQ
ncbi:FAD/NAD(P)-binding domain-containing protein [Periconia macrospinosa]|uniref:FAD/NAD(P)-binding domain-containing protein n=1 Tax=Periconia macrospinosa TaxID=97972 RepID=A0A2V1CYP9_9PLEO|nr:FAD/NAD(P)-binding domain-containing protein [Periconia macrospinosa]